MAILRRLEASALGKVISKIPSLRLATVLAESTSTGKVN